MTIAPARFHCDVPSAALSFFVIGTFAITWGVIGSYILLPDLTVALFEEISGAHPLYFAATWAPALTGVTLVLAYTGLDGLRAFLMRLLLWRCAPVWWVFIVLGIPIVFMAGSLLKGGPLLARQPPRQRTSWQQGQPGQQLQRQRDLHEKNERDHPGASGKRIFVTSAIKNGK